MSDDYLAWRMSFQSADQAAHAAFDRCGDLEALLSSDGPEGRKVTNAQFVALRAEIARLKSAPSVLLCGRTMGVPERVGPTNAGYFGIKLETDEDFAAFGHPYRERAE